MDTDLEHSVVLQGAQIARIHQRIDSVIGQRAQLSGSRRPKALRFSSVMTVKLNCRDLFPNYQLLFNKVNYH